MAGDTITSLADRFNTQHTSALGIELFGHPLLISQSVLGQDPNSKHVGTTVWDSSVVFAKFLEKNCNRGQLNGVQMAGKRAIELGAGCGVAGLAMALMGCNVVLTDQVEVLPLLLKNVERNVARIKLASVTSTSESVGLALPN
ncbi:protein N-lysine methyltransferase METTL21A-like isoform X1 [Selaginella moellendorffii]|uniref:protein N-lysine methyltransferase METTL21A-like isoform X1 n=1 Tax=Selaginella moellendorffii TaxID=88036 RepID=UPI000D1C398E|nr:protein N-lysine methyltransferase METTL21A-like isoform X1 [Selaginella moellendorffii]|eukprot:XP_024542272.1 protein N-lysine methyltransferase METTL21A-like isoform X1 [Selaginella moellendorffii]